jgi:protein-S-isoprenylcysteine O-methyltransferase Ste14
MSAKKLIIRLIVQTSLWLGFMAVLLFAAAGNWRWAQAWAFTIIFFLGSLAFGAWLIPRDPDLLASRLNPAPQRGQPLWDQVFLVTFIGLWFAWLVVMGLDAQRWHLSDMPLWLNVLGGALMIAGYWATTFVFRENSFAAPVVRVQSERKQHVIDTGPYAFVRHPMYAAALLYLFGIPLLLGSWYGLLIAPFIVAGMAGRAVSEERLLERDLPGYADYMKRVRYRLIPGLW